MTTRDTWKNAALLQVIANELQESSDRCEPARLDQYAAVLRHMAVELMADAPHHGAPVH